MHFIGREAAIFNVWKESLHVNIRHKHLAHRQGTGDATRRESRKILNGRHNINEG
jgi:hypothetical protein